MPRRSASAATCSLAYRPLNTDPIDGMHPSNRPVIDRLAVVPEAIGDNSSIATLIDFDAGAYAAAAIVAATSDYERETAVDTRLTLTCLPS